MLRPLFTYLLILISSSLIYSQDWRSEYSSAQQEYNNDNLEQAIINAKGCLKSYLNQDGSMSGNYESILRMLSNYSFEAGMYQEGIEYCNNELELKKKTGNINNIEHATALYNKGSYLEVLNEVDKALTTFEQSSAIFQQFFSPTQPQLIECQWKIAGCQYRLNNTEKAFNIFDSSIPLYDVSDGITMNYVNAIFDYSNLLMDKNQFDKAYKYLTELKDIYEQIGDGTEKELAFINTNKGLCLHKSGKYSQAEEDYLEADRLYHLIGEEGSKDYFSMINLRAINFEKLGDSNRASELLSMISTTGEGTSKASALNNEAMIFQQKGDYKSAEKSLLEAIAILKPEEDGELYIETSLNLANIKILNNDFEGAKLIINECKKLIINVDQNNSLIAMYHFTLAELENSIDKWNSSFENYKIALELLENNGIHNNLYLTILGALAIHYQDTGDYGKAEQYFLKQIKELEKEGLSNTNSYATTLNNLGTVKQNQADFLMAQNYLEKARLITANTQGINSKEYAGIVENLGLALTQLGEYSKAEELINQSIKIRKETVGEEHSLYANSIQNLGRIKQFRGKYQEAEPLFAQALRLKKNVFGENHPEYANTLNSSALLYQTMGNFEKAEPLFIEASIIYKNRYGNQHPEYATTLENLATLYKLEGKDEKALQLLEQTLTIDKITYGVNHPRYAVTLHNLASIYKDLDQTEKARELYKQALEIDKNVYGEKHPAFASTLYNLAVLNQQLNQFDEAESNFKTTLSIRKEILGENHPDYAYALYGLAGLYHATNKYKNAKIYYDQVIINYLQQIKDFFPSLSENEKGAFYAKIKPVLESYQDFCVEYAMSGNPNSKLIIGDLYNLQLSTKALLLHSSNKVRNRIYDSGNQNLIDEYTAWTESKEKLSKYLSYSQEQLNEQNINIVDLSNEINDLEKSLSQKSEIFSDDVEKKNYTWQEIKIFLGAKQAALEIIRIKKRFVEDSVMYIALIVRKDSETAPEMVIIKDGKSLEKKYFNYYRNAIKYTVGDDISFKEFWQPVDEQLEGIEYVFASTDGIYNKININTLWNTGQEQYVLDEYNVRSLSNTREILLSNTSPVATNNIAEVFGNPDFNLSLTEQLDDGRARTRASEFGFGDIIPDLPGTKTEVNKLNSLLEAQQWNSNLYLREEANENKIKSIAPPKLLHIATHGFFKSDVVFEHNNEGGKNFNRVEQNPLFRSGLLLAGSGKSVTLSGDFDQEDGVLTAYEAMNLNLDNTELVVLSACETGIGAVRNGEGVYGLQRSFMVAGAKAVIMSLWQVDDNTTQLLMINFYKNWLSGTNKFEAFKNAQLELKKEYGDPFHWGAFIILGTD